MMYRFRKLSCRAFISSTLTALKLFGPNTRFRVMNCFKQDKRRATQITPGVALVLQQPRDYYKLAAIAETLNIPDKVYILDDYAKNKRFASQAVNALRKKGIIFHTASQIVQDGCRFRIGIYATHTKYEKTPKFRQELLPLWLARKKIKNKKTWVTAWDFFAEWWDEFQRRHLKEMVTPRKTFKALYKSFRRLLIVRILAAHDISQVSVLAPHYYDNVSSFYPEAHIRDTFRLFLVASERQRDAVMQKVGTRAQLIGYPQYWAAQSIDNPEEKLRYELNIGTDKRIVAWLPVSASRDLTPLMDYLQPLVAHFTLVLRPHPDLYLPDYEGLRHKVQQDAHDRGILIQDSDTTDAGLLVRGADLVLAQGVSSLLSSIFLGARAAVGPDALLLKHRQWDATAKAGLADLPTIDRNVLSRRDLLERLKNRQWWERVDSASERVRRNFFGPVTSAEVGRQRCAAALNQLITPSGNQKCP